MKRLFPTACVCCRKKKIKCDGQFPCWQCSTKNLECQYQEPRKRGPKSGLLAQLKEENEKLKKCMEKLETSQPEPSNCSSSSFGLHPTNSFSSSSSLSSSSSPCSSPHSGVHFPFSPPKTETSPPPFSSLSSPVFGNLNDFVDLESHQIRLFLGVYFHFINRILPMVDEEKFRGMYARLGHCSSHHFSAFTMQLYGILAIVSRISCQPSQAEQHIAKARTAAKEMFDQPSEEVISGLCLITYYNYGVGDRAKAGCSVALAAQMCHLVPVVDSLLCACRVLCLGSEGAVSLLPPTRRKMDTPVEDASSAHVEFLLQILPASFKMNSKQPLSEKALDSNLLQSYLSNMDKAWALQERFELGGPMNFSYRFMINGIRSWIYLSLGNIPKAIEYTNSASLLTSNRFNIFFCSFAGGLCYQMAKFHLTHRQPEIFALIFQTLSQIADRWDYMRGPLRRLQSLNSNSNETLPSKVNPQPTSSSSNAHETSKIQHTMFNPNPSCGSSICFDNLSEFQNVFSPFSIFETNPSIETTNNNSTPSSSFSSLLENQEFDPSFFQLTQTTPSWVV